MQQEHLILSQLDYSVYEVFPLTKGNKTKLCKLIEKEIGTEYEINVDGREYDVVIFDLEEKRERELIKDFVKKINESR